MVVNGHEMHCHHLPDEALLGIFALTPAATRISSIPCVCKRWKRVASTPGALWEAVSVKCTFPFVHDRHKGVPALKQLA
ncbi:hypothetical protein WJX72_009809 [[Myrmecia] bisecta]|uniref:F-box domain-containing protein n=1 Tax=[Myrmecia] bisecta TaxID=41462 RepID=A0AAW1QTE3_9CHLO